MVVVCVHERGHFVDFLTARPFGEEVGCHIPVVEPYDVSGERKRRHVAFADLSDGILSPDPLIAVRLVVGDAPPVNVPYLGWLARGLEGLEMGKSRGDGVDSPGHGDNPAFRPPETLTATAFRTMGSMHLGREYASKEGVGNAS